MMLNGGVGTGQVYLTVNRAKLCTLGTEVSSILDLEISLKILEMEILTNFWAPKAFC